MDGTVSFASAFAGHQEGIENRDHKFLRKAVEEAYKGGTRIPCSQKFLSQCPIWCCYSLQ
ncbi:hypothetical protein Lalb_Chr23g0276111 [Lupinus albus]|uniref:Uncharacterized protein n=1 Tax=Lupinus albus TaxID=3870 RepID=A0A6A4NJG9_LUPAL|nr:hypothetical protein Lalb_Chr23g0276111 [Lupinus albus]